MPSPAGAASRHSNNLVSVMCLKLAVHCNTCGWTALAWQESQMLVDVQSLPIILGYEMYDCRNVSSVKVHHHTCILLVCWGANGVAVVAADEQAGCSQRGSKVERCMEVPFAGCTLSKVCGCHSVSSIQLQQQQQIEDEQHQQHSRHKRTQANAET
jgi:hypothetical protein